MKISTIITSKTKDTKEKLKPKQIILKILAKASIFVGVFAFWILIWQLIYNGVGKDVIVPSPYNTWARIKELVATQEFWEITWDSVKRILLGYLCGVGLGLFLAVVTYTSKFLYVLLKPLISIARATPVASLTIILVVWVTNQKVPLFIVGLMVFPIIWANTYEGIKNTDKKLLQMSKSFSVGGLKRLFHIYFPSVYPYFIAGASTALGLAWKSGIAAEILGSTQNSVGQQINDAKVMLDSEGKFAWTIVVVLLSILFERALVLLLKHTSLHIPLRAKSSEAKEELSGKRGFVIGRGISKSYGKNIVLSDVDVEVQAGEVLALRGVSGAGKTTLLMILSSLLKKDKGKIEKEGGVSFLFQEDRLLPWLTAKENILYVNNQADVKALLRLVSLADAEDMYPDELSGGMKRRLAIARTLAGKGEVVFLDEPFTGLDEELREETSEKVFDYLKDRAVILITHDSEEAKRFATKELYIG
ncbi:MAG: ATP-binding cassette domain-containing protein [Ruminococcaceae bacterium]|nr:ATP-binding cassette domain-containing protein [Oscillospiraceae bacterium]